MQIATAALAATLIATPSGASTPLPADAGPGVRAAEVVPAAREGRHDRNQGRGGRDDAASASSAARAPLGDMPPGMAEAMRRDLDLDDRAIAERLRVEAVAGDVEEQLRSRLGDEFGGAWIPEDGTVLTVAVTDEAAAVVVREAGAEVQLVDHSATELDDAKGQLDERAGEAGDEIHGWYVDATTNALVVMADPSATSAAQEFAAASGLAADAIEVVTSDEAPELLYDVRGGDQIHLNNAALCSVGFSVVGGYLTAGHCGATGHPVNGFNGVAQGTVRGSTFPGADHAWVQTNSSWTPRPWVSNHSGGNVTVAGSTEAPVGASVCRSGRTTGWQCGVITAKNVTANYAQGPVYGLTYTTACAAPGDSGGAFISGNQAQGITSGGLPCNPNGVSTFQPINPALAAYNLRLVTVGTPVAPGVTTVSIRSRLNNRCIDIPGANAIDGTRLQMWDCNNTVAQRWTFAGDGTVRAMGMCLDPAAGGTANGTPVQLVHCNGNPVQRFTLTAAGDLVNLNANKCVDIVNVDPNIGARMHLWHCVGGAHQRWYLG